MLAPGATYSTTRSRASRIRPSAPRVRTDPLPLIGSVEPPEGTESSAHSHARSPSEQSLKYDRSNIPADVDASSKTIVPKAIVVSGLEHVSVVGQRTLSQVLMEKRLILDDTYPVAGTWNLPDDFMVVYVCAADTQERPMISRVLVSPHKLDSSRPKFIFVQLDKFALSADITISSELRQAYTAYRAAYSTSFYSSPSSPLPSPRVHTPTLSPLDSLFSNGSKMSPRLRPNSTLSSPPPPVVSQTDLQYLRALAAPLPSSLAHAYTAMQPSLSAYLNDLFAATRHHPELDGALLTHRTHVDAEALARAFRVLAGDSIGAGLVHAASASDQASEPWTASEEELGLKMESGMPNSALMPSILAPVRIEIDGTETINVQGDWDKYPASSNAHGRTESETIAPGGGFPEVWDVSEVDIARIFPRVVSHRLRVRDGPEEEVLGSLLWPAVQVTMRGGERIVPAHHGMWVRRTVKEILVGVLADV